MRKNRAMSDRTGQHYADPTHGLAGEGREGMAEETQP